MSLSIGGIVFGVLKGITLVREVIKDGRELYTKAKDYSREEWEVRDYLETLGDVASLGAGLFRIKAEKDQWVLQKELSESSKKLKVIKECRQEMEARKEFPSERDGIRIEDLGGFENNEGEFRAVKMVVFPWSPGVVYSASFNYMKKLLDQDKINFEKAHKKTSALFQKSKQSEACASIVKAVGVATKKVARGEGIRGAVANKEVLNGVGAGLYNAGLASGNDHLRMAGEALVDGVIVAEGVQAAREVTELAKPYISALLNRVKALIENYNGRRIYFATGPGLTVPMINIPPQDDDYAFIPAIYEDNAVFSQYICGINHSPMRYPAFVLVNGVRQNYELLTLIKHIYVNGAWDEAGDLVARDPLTNQPIRIGDVHMDINTQMAIETEMRRLNIL